MFGETVFALIPDHEVQPAKLTNRWISGCWWRREASSDEHQAVRSLVCSSADQFAGNLLENIGADAKRSRLEGRNGILMWKWTLEYLDHQWLHVQMKGCRQQRHRRRFPQYLHLHLRQKSTCMKCEDKECTRKHSKSELSGQKSAELLDARHVRRLVQGSHTLVNASRIKMPGTRAAEPHQRRRRNVELLEIQIHDRWTRVEVRWIPSRRGQKRRLRQTTRTRLTRWTRTTSNEDQRHLINWNQWTMKTCRRRHEWQETFFTSVVRTMRNSMSTRKLGRTLKWRFTQASRVP